MNFEINKSADIVDEVLRFRTKIMRIWFFRALISGLIAGIATLFLTLIVSRILPELPFFSFFFSVVPASLIIFVRYNFLKHNINHIPEYIDKQLCNDISVLTCFELAYVDKQNSEFLEILKSHTKKQVANKDFIEFRVFASAVELILLIFLCLVTAVLLIVSKPKTRFIESPRSNLKAIEKLVEIEALAQINNDKNVLKLIAETKQKLLRNELNALSTFFSSVDEEVERRDQTNNNITTFIEKTKSTNEGDEELMKRALELAQKQLAQRVSEKDVQSEIEKLKHLDLDEIIAILQKNLKEDELLKQKLLAFIEKANIQDNANSKETLNSENNSHSKNNNKEHLNPWVYKKYKLAKIEIIKENDASSIINYHAISEKYSSFKHSDFRKRIIAELNNNN